MGNHAKYCAIAEKYGYHVSVIDLCNPTRSHGNNLLHLVNKYMDAYLECPDQLAYKAKAEKYAKIIAKTIIMSGMDGASFGDNAYFYDAAEGLLTATIAETAHRVCVQNYPGVTGTLPAERPEPVSATHVHAPQQPQGEMVCRGRSEHLQGVHGGCRELPK